MAKNYDELLKELRASTEVQSNSNTYYERLRALEAQIQRAQDLMAPPRLFIQEEATPKTVAGTSATDQQWWDEGPRLFKYEGGAWDVYKEAGKWITREMEAREKAERVGDQNEWGEISP